MPDAYSLTESRFILHKYAVSVANDHINLIGPVPKGKIWSILSAIGMTSADDTQDYWFGIYVTGVINYSITRPEQHIFDVSEANWLPLLREGMEIKLFPGEYLSFSRDGHVAGSTISMWARIIETDMPLYVYDEPQIVRRQAAAASTLRTMLGGGRASAPGTRDIAGRIPGSRTKEG